MDERIKSYIKENLSLEQLRDANKLNIPVFKDDIQKIIEELETEQIHYVDLDLPSGTLWADRNVDAKYLWEYGKYFNFENAQKQGCLPARWQMCELIDCTQHCVCKMKGVKGMHFIGKNGNSIFMPFAGYLDYKDDTLCAVGNCGRWWSCTPNDSYAYRLCLDIDGDVDPSDDINRTHGQSVRLIQ